MCDTIKDIEDAIRIQAKILAANGDHLGSVQALRTLLSSKYRLKELELKGLNMRDPEGEEVVFTSVDYRKPYQEEKHRAEKLAEENAALQAQIDAMGAAKERPRPPRPAMN